MHGWLLGWMGLFMLSGAYDVDPNHHIARS